jgi:dTDP-glucose pyrophosphorylase
MPPHIKNQMIKEFAIAPHATLKDALKRIDQATTGTLVVLDDNGHLIGTLSDGDARRAILNGASLDKDIFEVFNRTPYSLQTEHLTKEGARHLFLDKRLKLIPIVDREGTLHDVLTWDGFFANEEVPPIPHTHASIGVPVVIMAGGKGTRLAPFTNVLPKPLIPIGERTILELIIDEFVKYGVDQFHLTINYRGEMIRAYIEGLDRTYKVGYAWEKEFCGTAGSLTLVRDQIDSDFIVSNCDIIVKANYADVLRFHRESEAALTMVSAIQHHKIPYGVIDFQPGGVVSSIREKPEYTVNINTGVYVLSRACLDLIPEGEFFHMTDLIDTLLKAGEKVVTYPVNENDYIDIGQWDEYHDALDRLKGIK